MTKEYDLNFAEWTTREKVELCSGRNNYETYGNMSRDIPALRICDGPNGVRFSENMNIKGSTFYDTLTFGFLSEEELKQCAESVCFPSISCLASSWNSELLRRVGACLAIRCRSLGIQAITGPGMNIRRHPLTARNFEYFSEDPFLTGRLAAGYVHGVQHNGVASCLKHFACHNSDTKRTRVNVHVDERALREIYLSAFEFVIHTANPALIMAAYNRINDTAVCENSYLLTEILRKEWGYEGAVISDWGAVKDSAAATEAGLDLQMPYCPGSEAYLEESIHSKRISTQKLDQRVARMIELTSFVSDPPTVPDYNPDAAHALAVEAAEESIILLKNRDSLLPLDPQRLKRIAVLGQLAKLPLYQGKGSAIVHTNRVDTPFDCIEEYVAGRCRVDYASGYTDCNTNQKLILEAECAAKKADVAIVFVGMVDKAEADNFNLKSMELMPSSLSLIQSAVKCCKNTVVILQNGTEALLPFREDVGAIVETWYGGEGIGRALARILFGDVNPSGKLPVTVPNRIEDTPAYLMFPWDDFDMHYCESIYVGYRCYDRKKTEPAYPFGYGLSYTRYEYDSIELSTRNLQLPSSLTVCVQVRNVGAMDGKEIVQLYLHQNSPQLPRPERELKGFQKLYIPAGETRTATFELNIRDFSYYDPALKDWVADTDEFEVQIGASSRDIRLSETINVHAAKEQIRAVQKDCGFAELLATPRGEYACYNFLIEHGILPETALNDPDLRRKLVWMFYSVHAVMDMQSFGKCDYKMTDEMIDAVNQALISSPGK